ncbi:predicted protein [Naegleria gruberi]|uniref:Predicted protein n=1 Tax=Naegleria gruberi TaxID=5762 RepID=D2VEI4_NAEGR|nr:uncharacterized protein NAEGRDRAFT_57972 [Naegleria gruberi]EFC44885.1 predicted protein [Naegleria gruberi]|eukprot:XP_002677629.1 predicted protein [Naegleria gruberi strain NEG-M]
MYNTTMRTRTIPVNNNSASSTTPSFLFDSSNSGGVINSSLFKTTTTSSSTNSRNNSLLIPSSEILLNNGQSIQQQQQHNSLLDDEFQDDFTTGFEDTASTPTNNQPLFQSSSNPIFMLNNASSTSPTSSSSEAFQFSSFVDDDDGGQTTSDSYISSSSHLSLTPPGLTYMMSQHSIQPNNNHSHYGQHTTTPLMNTYNPLLNPNMMNSLQHNLFQQQLLNMTPPTTNEQMFLNEDLLTNSREDVEPLLEDQDIIANLSNTLLFQQQLQKLQQQQLLQSTGGLNIPNSIPRSKPQLVPQLGPQQMLNNTQQQYMNQYNMSLIEEMLINGTIPPSTNLEELQQAILRASASNLLPSTPPSVSSSPPSAFHLQQQNLAQQNLALSRQLAQQQQVVASMIGSQMKSLQVVQELIQQQQQQQQQTTKPAVSTPTSTTSSNSSITRSKTMPSISSASSSNIIPISSLYPQTSNNRNPQRPKSNLPKQPTEQTEVQNNTEESEDSANKNTIDLDDAYENYALNSNNLSSVELYNTMMNTLQQNQKLLANAYGNLANLANTITQQQNAVSGMKRSTSTTSVSSNTSSSSQTSGYPYSSIPFSPLSRSQSMNCLSSINANNLHIPTESSLTSFGEQIVQPEKPSSSEMKRSMSTSSMRNLKRAKSKKMPPTRSSDNLTGLLEKEMDKETSKKRKNNNFSKKGRKKNHSESSNDLLALEKSAESELNNTTENNNDTETSETLEVPTPTDSTHSADFIVEESTTPRETRPKAKSVKIGGVIGGVRKAHSMDSIALAAQNQQQFAPMDPPSEPKQKAIKAKSKKALAFQNESQQPPVPGAGMFVMSSFQPPPQCQGNKRWKFHEFDNEDKPIKDNDSGFTFHFYKPTKN